MATKSAVHKIGGRCGGKVVMLCNESAAVMITYLVLVSSIMGLAGAASRGGLQSEDSAPPSKVQKCREGCLDKVRFVMWLPCPRPLCCFLVGVLASERLCYILSWRHSSRIVSDWIQGGQDRIMPNRWEWDGDNDDDNIWIHASLENLCESCEFAIILYEQKVILALSPHHLPLWWCSSDVCIVNMGMDV